MLDNITALNIDEQLINNKTVKAGVGKYSKPAKLSSGKTFKAKTMEVMSKINNPVNSVPEAVPSVEPAQAVAEQAPAPTPAQVVETSATPEAKAPETPAIELPTPEQVIEKAKIVNISAQSVPSDGVKVVTPSRKLKVSKTVVTRNGNVFKVLESVNQEQVSEEAPEQANEEVQVAQPSEVQVAPPVDVATPETTPETAPQVETSDISEQPNFFLGQKLNTEEVTEEETKTETPLETTINNEVPEEPKKEMETTPEVTQEEKEDKLNQYLGRNQETPEEDAETLDLSDVLKDLDEYKTASEQIYSGQNEINKLNKDLAEARRILAEKKKEAQQMIVNAKEILESQRNEITSKTQELSDVRDAIIRWTELKEKNQNRANQEEENTLGKVA